MITKVHIYSDELYEVPGNLSVWKVRTGTEGNIEEGRRR
ncbi:hypothetical protein J2S19_002938 [Metabacillus malikii]|uniref:Uncharacterized protein n=1 Tax=Metabacillus malikii TaxID=1504265 RepID=A0ABT9ZH92_9BACI|nr:hypothetical protein [Metabacillus malikii]